MEKDGKFGKRRRTGQVLLCRSRLLPSRNRQRKLVVAVDAAETLHLPIVKVVGKFAVLLMALSVFASPLMACLLPDSTLTEEVPPLSACYPAAGTP